MKQYLTLLQDILNKGTWKVPARENLPPTLSLFGTRMEFDMADGFPLLTTKEVHFKSVIVELLWFLKGDTNIKYLVDNGCNIWNKDAYRWYLKTWNQYSDGFIKQCGDIEEPYSIKEFIEQIKLGEVGNTSIPTDYILGDLGKVYGHQWRNQNGIDQIQTVLDRLQSEPEGRYAILDAWNPADFSEMALPPCHLLYQFNCRKLSHEEKIQWVINNTETEMENLAIYEESCKESTPKYYIDLQLYQRSCDTLLGVPFNIASGALLLHIIAKIVGMEPGKFIWVGGDTHIYENHMEQVKEQLSRIPTQLPQLHINQFMTDTLDQLSWEDFKVINYRPQAKIKGELNAGLKK
jgi:thymidylate synthase